MELVVVHLASTRHFHRRDLAESSFPARNGLKDEFHQIRLQRRCSVMLSSSR